jgi:glycosyltransferase involved in cell wall biosynthesis
MSSKISILHISSVHFAYDSRIVYRMCQTLSAHYDVTLMIPQADAQALPSVRWVSLPFYRKLWQRLLWVHPIIGWKALRTPHRVLHFHDPELIPLAFLLWVLGKKIIFDVHENTRKQLKTKSFNNSWLFRWAFELFDRWATRHFSIVLAEHAYQHTYHDLAQPSATVLNYPSLPFFDQLPRPASPQPPVLRIFYIGQISYARCIHVKIAAMALLQDRYPNLRMDLYGNSEFDLFDLDSLQQLPTFDQVRHRLFFHGKTDPKLAFAQAQGAQVGLALLQPIGDFMDSYPTKLFEYMALGMPVITSDFPLYRAIVDTHDCGLCIEPTSVEDLAEALTFLIENPAEAQRMGQNGRRAVEQYFNWESEAQKLRALYDQLLKK